MTESRASAGNSHPTLPSLSGLYTTTRGVKSVCRYRERLAIAADRSNAAHEAMVGSNEYSRPDELFLRNNRAMGHGAG